MREYRVFVWAWTNHYGRMSVCVNARDENDATKQAIGLACKMTKMEPSEFLALAGLTYGE